MPPKTSMLVLAALALGASAALAPASAQGPGRGLQRFESIDTNDDELISSEEHTAWQESVFTAMDADASGDLTEAEYMAVRMGPGPRPGGRGLRAAERQARKKKRFHEMDSDGDGKVSKDQFMAYGDKRFKEADTDESGTLTFEEFRAHHRWNRP